MRSFSLRKFFSLPVAAIYLSLGFAFSPSWGADSTAERGELERLIHEIEQIEATIYAAEAKAVSSQRVHFQYQWLRSDLARVKAGIREYLETVPLTPRAIPPLAGDYIR